MRALVVLSAGFAETGPAGAALQHELGAVRLSPPAPRLPASRISCT